MVRSDWYKNWADIARFNQKPFPGVSLDALKFLHLERKILFHGHEPLDTDTTPTLEGESWLMHNHFAQAEGVANLDQVPEAGALIVIGFAKPLGGTGGYARYVAIAPADWHAGRVDRRNAGRAAADAGESAEARRARRHAADGGIARHEARTDPRRHRRVDLRAVARPVLPGRTAGQARA